MHDPAVTTLFLDIGGVLGTNGWDRGMRRQASETFSLNYEEMDERHHLTFDTYEEGKLSLDEYLDRVVFDRPRPFSREEFKQYMYAQSKPNEQMIALVRGLKAQYGLKTAVVSNEGRELTVHRIHKFGLNGLIDFFISSCFVHIRKPDADIWRLALDVAQVQPENVLYIEDRALFVQVAASLGIRGVKHIDYEGTKRVLAEAGLVLKAPGPA